MHTLRCLDCNDLRWMPLVIGKREPGPCELCGGRMVVERREPEHGGKRLDSERRGIGVKAGPPFRPASR